MSVFDFEAFDRLRERTEARIRRRSRLGWHAGLFIVLNGLYWTYFLYLQGFYTNHDLFGLILTPSWGVLLLAHLLWMLRTESRMDAQMLRDAELQARASVGAMSRDYAYLETPDGSEDVQVLSYAGEKRKNRG